LTTRFQPPWAAVFFDFGLMRKMNPTTSPSILAIQEQDEITERVDGSAYFSISDQLTCEYVRHDGVLWSRWNPHGVPAFNSELLHDLERGSQLIEGYFLHAQVKRPLDYIVLRSAAKGAFNVGGDLGYFQRLIVAQDRARLTEYARAAINVLYRNYSSHNLSGVTTIALLEGDALGGGFECALSCDIVIAEKHVRAGFPEVLFNMFPGMGGMSFLARRINRKVADELVRTGRQYSATELLELGIIDEVVNSGDGVSAVEHLMKQRQRQRTAHAAMNRVDRLIRPVNFQELHDIVKIWVDCALELSPHGLEWMQRLYQRQLAVFGRPFEGNSKSIYSVKTAAA
jgi:DSF synthase